MSMLLLAWSFRMFLPAGEVSGLYALEDRVVLTAPGGILVMDTSGAPLAGIPTETSPVLAVLAPDGGNLYWVDSEGDLYRGNLQRLQSLRLLHLGEGHSMATDGQRVFFATLNDRVVTVDPNGFLRHEPRPRRLRWTGLWGQVPRTHTGWIFLDPVRTRLSFLDPDRDLAWVMEDSGLVRVDLRTGMRRDYGFPLPPVYPLEGVFLHPQPGVYGENGAAVLERGAWQTVIVGERVVAACPPRHFLTPFVLFIREGGLSRTFPLTGGPYRRMACSQGRIWVGGRDGVREVGKGLLLSLEIRDLLYQDRLWVASAVGLFALEDTAWVRLQDTAGVLEGEVLDLAAGGRRVYAATPRGVVAIQDSSLQILSRFSMERVVSAGETVVGWNGFRLVRLDAGESIPLYVPVEPRDVMAMAATPESLAVASPGGIWWFGP